MTKQQIELFVALMRGAMKNLVHKANQGQLFSLLIVRALAAAVLAAVLAIAFTQKVGILHLVAETADDDLGLLLPADCRRRIARGIPDRKRVVSVVGEGKISR